MNAETGKSRILIVDDYPLIRAGVAAVLSRQDDLTLCGEAADEDEAVELAVRLQPQLVIVDLCLKSGSGLDVIRRLKPAHGPVPGPGPRILVHSMYEDALYAERVLQAGAMGYINKHESLTHFLEAIRRVLSGKLYVSADVAERLMNRVIGHRNPGDGPAIERLSDRELQIFRLIGEAIATRRIAEQLFLSVHTVETHRENIKRKLGLRNGSELTQRAVQWVLENQ